MSSTQLSTSEFYLGVMTGTSLDGVDVALVEIDTNKSKHTPLKLIHSRAFHLPDSLTEQLAQLSQVDFEPSSLLQIKSLEQAYTLAIADCVNAFVSQLPWSHPIKAIGCHGLTVCHHPKAAPEHDLQQGFSWQILDGSLLSAKTQLDVIYDFRSKDVALGGEGAPLVPPFHQTLFQHLDNEYARQTVCLNLGGIANISFWRDGLCYGFDTGPANTLMDHWVQLYQQLSYDADGQWAAQGQFCESLLEHLLDDPYFSQAFPKSTGKEYFNLSWLKQKLAIFSDTSKQTCGTMKPVDVQATLLHLTAKSIALAILTIADKGVLVCCGGGAKNGQLLKTISDYLPNYTIKTSSELGVSGDDIEAMAFAWLAFCRVHDIAAGKSTVTNAKKDSVLGAWVSAL